MDALPILKASPMEQERNALLFMRRDCGMGKALIEEFKAAVGDGWARAALVAESRWIYGFDELMEFAKEVME